jgi:hypothetical protein
MKTTIKLLLAGTALASAAAANASNITITGGESDLVLFVSDTTTGHASYFIQDLGVNVDSLGKTTANIAADPNSYNSQTTNAPGPGLSLTGITGGVDGTLQNYLNAHTGDTFKYSIIGFSGGVNSNAGTSRFVATTTPANALGQNGIGSNPGDLDAQNTANTTNAWFQSLNLLSLDANLSNTSGGFLAPGSGAQAATGFGFLANGAALGTALNIYEFSSFGGQDSSLNDLAQWYGSSDTITVSTNGMISVSDAGGPTVPLPAAVWLLGSGLLGLFGVARRNGVPVPA